VGVGLTEQQLPIGNSVRELFGGNGLCQGLFKIHSVYPVVNPESMVDC